MNIFFDDRWLGGHGIGRFARELRDRLPLQPMNLEGSPSNPLDPWRLGRATRRLDSDALLFVPGYNPPLFGGHPYVISIHDLNHVDRPENSSVSKRLYYRLVLGPLSRRADAVLTVSEFSRQRIIDHFGVQPHRVVNVGNGVSEVFNSEGPRIANKRPIVLCVSNRKGHKNEECLLRAFSASGLSTTHELLLTGDSAPAQAALASLLGIDHAVRFTGNLSEPDLAALYRSAEFLVFPSLYEGFGLPIVEAFASGTPVITANVTSMPEIAGDAALLVDPTSDSEIAQAMRRLADSPTLRQALTARGRLRAPDFKWDAVASRVQEVFQRLGFDGTSAVRRAP